MQDHTPALDEQVIRGFRLSPQQRRLSSARTAPEVRFVFVVDGISGDDAVAAAIAELAGRHEILRTRFAHLAGMAHPLQVVVDAAPGPAFIAPRAEGEPEPALLARTKAALPAPAPGGPETTWAIAHAGGDRWVIGLRTSALCADRETAGHLAAELCALLAARAGHAADELAPAVQHADYADWVAELTASGEAVPGLAHWERHASVEASVVPGLDEPPSEGAVERSFAVDDETLAALGRVGAERGLHLEALLLAAVAATVDCHTGRGEVRLDVLLGGRDHADLAGAIGPFAQRAPFAAPVDARAPFAALAADVHARLREHAQWQECLDGAGEGTAGVVFAFERAPASAARAGVTVRVAACEVEEPASGGIRVGFTWSPETARLTCALRLDGARYGRVFADLFAQRLATLIASAGRDPERAVARLDLVGAAELERILALGRGEGDLAAAAPLTGRTVVDEILERAGERPERVAVTAGGVSLTYRELEARTRAVAGALAARGVGPESRVVVLIERSVDLIVGVLGVLRAGAAYVPVDPSYPESRLRFILAQAATPLVVAHAATADRARAACATTSALLLVDALAGAPAAPAPGAAALPGPAPGSLAYAIYTSGSTGEPKGVEVTHANLHASMRARCALFGEPTERCLLLYSFAFDSSVAPIFNTLCEGGTLVIAEEGAQRDAAAIARLIRAHRVTVTYCNPNLWGALLDAVPLDELALHRFAVVAGEACVPALVRKHVERLPGTRLLNEYGPTEATVWCTARACVPEDASAARVPIGRPAANARIYVLDRDLRPAPLGAAGEIYVGGQGVARCYARRPDLTAERFCPDPFAAAPGARMYRTGDRARFRADGALEFMGRVDDQVKVRGYRVEPAEIESVIASFPAVREAVVVARDDGEGARLYGYLAAAPGGPSDEELRERIAGRLPSYMVPSAFVRLDRLPRTVNGKVDRAALPAPVAPAAAEGVAPRTATEQALAEIWSLVLRADRVGIDDNFFTLGGDSIRSIRVQAHAAKRGLHFTPTQLFESPTVRSLAAWLDENGRVAAAGGGSVAPFALLQGAPDADRARLPADAEDAFPLTELQLGVLAHSLRAPGSASYHDVASYHLRAPFDEAAFRRALGELARRHPVLRSSVDLTGFSEPLQIVHARADIPLEVHDWTGLTEAAQAAALDEHLERARAGEFDLQRGPFLRIAVHRRGPNSFQFTRAQHHVLLDGWSSAVMVTELFQLYARELGIEAPALAPPARAGQRDCAALERQALASEAARGYWRGALEGAALTPVAVPSSPASTRDAPEAPVRNVRERIAAPVHAGLAALAAELGVPLKTVLLAAHLRALGFLCGRRDVVTGLVVNCRPESEDGDRALGMFLNTVPLRLRLGRGSWRDLIRQVHEAERAMDAHRRYPLAQLVRERGGAPLFDVLFNFAHFHAYDAGLSLPGIEVLDGRELGETPLALSVACSLDPAGGGLSILFSGSASLFSDDEVRRVASATLRALNAMAGAPDAAHAELELLTADARALALSNAEARIEWSGPMRIDARVEAQVRRTPEALAVWAGDERVTYAGLWARAAAVAAELASRGVGREDHVGICMDRSVDAVVSVLGVLIAGAVFVPLDPEYPAERIAFMVRDACASIVLVDARGAAKVAGTGVATVSVAGCAREPLRAALDRRSPDDAAYIIYTSGSTGLPKGVVVPHRQLCNNLLWRQRRFPLAEGHRFLHRTSLNFDVSLWELFAPLLAGATVVVAPPAVLRDAMGLARLIVAAEITELWFMPQLLDHFLAEPDAPRCAATLRRVFAGGEALARSTRDRFFAVLPSTQLVHTYGPTETTIDVTQWPCARESEVVPIGRPIGNSSCYVVDEDLRLVRPGAIGELCIGGLAVARGYWGRPGLTAERFVPDPFSATPGARMYRSGDDVRLLPDGEIEFIGRRDGQVKVRGYRVEIQEVEAALVAVAGVRAAACAVRRDDAAGGAHLVGYVVLEAGATPAAVAAALAERLPAHMVPGELVELDAIPRMPSGKVDRGALPAAAAPAEVAPAEPQDAVARELAEIWRGVLGRPAIGANADFFRLGGDSLSAMRMMLRVRARFGLALPTAVLYERPTLEHLAGAIRARRPAEASALVLLEDGPAEAPPLFLVHAAGGGVDMYRDLAFRLGARRRVYGLRAPGLSAEGERAAAPSVEALVAPYRALIEEVCPRGPLLLGGWSLGGVLAFELGRQLVRAGREVPLVALIDSRPPGAAPPAPPLDEAALIAGFAADLGLHDAGLFSELASDLAAADPPRRLALVQAHAKARAFLPEEAADEQIQRLYEVYAAHVRAAAAYEGARYPGALLLLRATAALADAGEAARRWRALAGRLEVRDVEADHASILRAPAASAVARLLEARMHEEGLDPSPSAPGTGPGEERS
ncbi:amino acid adenylation domain-containing protein [Sorangium sp. So ce1389]|uniref:amino acid adenylation domain-containing protein n=1 Tax=Sorangium sp. So ce1389 TaxID=3133336 RepID=UPI003F613AA7